MQAFRGDREATHNASDPGQVATGDLLNVLGAGLGQHIDQRGFKADTGDSVDDGGGGRDGTGFANCLFDFCGELNVVRVWESC